MIDYGKQLERDKQPCHPVEDGGGVGGGGIALWGKGGNNTKAEGGELRRR